MISLSRFAVSLLRFLTVKTSITTILLILSGVTTASFAATHVYVQNNTTQPIDVIELSVDGDPLSKKAWKKGVSRIPAGERVVVLSINRTGKFNWMDPTPRFIEPGKTVYFTIILSNENSDTSVKFKQKLLGTGSGSRLWYGIEVPNTALQWSLPYQSISGNLQQGSRYRYSAVKSEKDDNLEIIIN